jgi:hypothetical protein
MHDLLEKRNEYAKAILPFLYAAEWYGWYHFVIVDESWFFLNISPRRMWIVSRGDVVAKPRYDVQSEKCMLRIIGNAGSFHKVARKS